MNSTTVAAYDIGIYQTFAIVNEMTSSSSKTSLPMQQFTQVTINDNHAQYDIKAQFNSFNPNPCGKSHTMTSLNI